jgi:prepilin-type processing-associated H-X9-DG protein
LALATQMYHDATLKLPLSFDSNWPLSTTWFGLVDYSTETVDLSRGFLAPYMEQSQKIYKCPEKTPQITQLYGGSNGGYGYNQNLGTTEWAPPNYIPQEVTRDMAYFPSTSTTVVLSDSARIQLPYWGNPAILATDNWYLQGPNDSSTAPGTHFRHSGLAIVAYLDGHCENRSEARWTVPGSWPAEAVDLRAKRRIGYIYSTSVENYRPY